MNSLNSDLPKFAEQFKANFAKIAPLILEEWPHISAEQLVATNGEFAPVIDCIATATEHTHALIRRQLQELCQVAIYEQLKPVSSRLPERLTQFTNEKLTDPHFKVAVEQLEAQTEKLLHQLKQEILPELHQKVQKNPMGSLLAAVGVGFVMGLLLGGRRGR